MGSLAEAMRNVQAGIDAGPFAATWDSLVGYTVPDWYLDGKFGIFLHWGVYAVPAFGNEWYPRSMYQAGSDAFKHHVETYGPQASFGYKDFIPQFKAEHYDPAAWAALFKEAGATFVVPVAEHHDGFAMYDTALSGWCAAKMGPRRDLIGDLATAVREAGMVFGVSSHRAEHWWFMDGGMAFDSDVKDPANAGLYGPAKPNNTQPDAAFLDDWLLRCCELVDSYRPQLFWFDWWIEQPVFAPYLQRFAAFYYNRGAEWGQGVAINYKNKSFREGSAVFDIERGQFSGASPRFWQNDTSVSKNSWGYIAHHDYKEPVSIVGDLVDVVSKNGALLLNLGPRPDGTIPEPEQAILRSLGRWLATNGAAIYDTRPWRVFGEGPTQIAEGSMSDTKRSAFTPQDVRFTAKDDKVYAILLGWPGGEACLRSLGGHAGVAEGAVQAVRLLGGGSLEFAQKGYGLVVQMPSAPPCEHAFVLEVAHDGSLSA